MAHSPYTNYSTLKTPQSEQIPGSNQVQNEAGGFGYPVTDWTRLKNFLILGTQGGSYYIGEQKLTRENADAVARCISEDGQRVVAQIVEVSHSGRAPKNDPALFALALCMGLGSPETRKAASSALPQVARTGTHLLNWIGYVRQFRGFGRGLRNAIANWYNTQDVSHLQYEVAKYPSRDGWSQRDALRLAHVMPKDQDYAAVLRWTTHGVAVPHDKESLAAKHTGLYLHDNLGPETNLKFLWAVEEDKAADDDTLVRLIREYNLPREVLGTEHLTKPAVWAALLDHMPMTAMIRNLATMTRIGLLNDFGKHTDTVVAALSDQERIRKARVHPMAILAALKVYAQGHGEKSSNTWKPITRIIDALDKAFYLSFGNVEPTGKRILIGLDVSGSMRSTMASGMPFLSCIEAQSAMALITASVEPNTTLVAFDTTAQPITISPRQRLDDVVQAVSRLVNGGTNCAVPIETALERKQPVDLFQIWTDSESWSGDQHVMQALKEYRKKMGLPAKLVVCQMAAAGTSIGDADDAGVLNISGLDASVPMVVASFATQ